mmetsp:Transcript_868/g.1367  ORF Transcript_868/g.1367 Transcript_868/m.1367 type:complete len:577 (-) Transcript_868:51-1781(-)|eukprot:CAMPEP_0184347672 /NCGR_PEP_ID=MMETSP1089-20130417/20147_1 /TAXON_ID=38269 ORGANISM="Gloeochaete wittrockiana, Strain SAG46.84" /NCGR_SAMPLE_ID=MMETSP1089 /ASSEMBLY_ACC=CAM_ASM_000445 /LENGTH=576 /DNA_ID=CAMNT_0026678891 /DNA_START=33 /DNA_END=1763 /DNA_ORIENTATION=+
MGKDTEMRVRLSFDPMLPLGELQKCWTLVPSTLQLVSDLALLILDRFQLKKCCPNGLVLEIGGFVLPPNQDICIVQRNDAISVKPKVVKQTWSDAVSRSGVSSSVTKKNTNECSSSSEDEEDDDEEEKARPVTRPFVRPAMASSSESLQRRAESSSSEEEDEDDEEEPRPVTKAAMWPVSSQYIHRAGATTQPVTKPLARTVTEKSQVSSSKPGESPNDGEDSSEESEGDGSAEDVTPPAGRPQQESRDTTPIKASVTSTNATGESEKKKLSRSARRRQARRLKKKAIASEPSSAQKPMPRQPGTQTAASLEEAKRRALSLAESTTSQEIPSAPVRAGHIRFGEEGDAQRTAVVAQVMDVSNLVVAGDVSMQEALSTHSTYELPPAPQESVKGIKALKRSRGDFSAQKKPKVQERAPSPPPQLPPAPRRDYESLPRLEKPTVGDVIAFKHMELIDWQPQVSDFKERLVVEYDTAAGVMLVQLCDEEGRPIQVPPLSSEEMDQDYQEEEGEEDIKPVQELVEMSTLHDLRIVRGSLSSPSTILHQDLSSTPSSSTPPVNTPLPLLNTGDTSGSLPQP